MGWPWDISIDYKQQYHSPKIFVRIFLIHTLDIKEILSQNWGTLINGLSRTIEYPSQHVF